MQTIFANIQPVGPVGLRFYPDFIPSKPAIPEIIKKHSIKEVKQKLKGHKKIKEVSRQEITLEL